MMTTRPLARRQRRRSSSPREDTVTRYRAGIYLTDDDVRWWRRHAAELERSLSAAMADALRAYRIAHEKERP
jgi:hypothetical protein